MKAGKVRWFKNGKFSEPEDFIIPDDIFLFKYFLIFL